MTDATQTPAQIAAGAKQLTALLTPLFDRAKLPPLMQPVAQVFLEQLLASLIANADVQKLIAKIERMHVLFDQVHSELAEVGA